MLRLLLRLPVVVAVWNSISASAIAEDVCKIVLIDFDKAEKGLDLDDSAKLLGEFRPHIGEDAETTEHFSLPAGRGYITVSVVYIDEFWVRRKDDSLLADAIVVGLRVTKTKEESAFSAFGDDGVRVQVPYNKDTTLVLLHRNIRLNRKRYVVDVECFCNDSKPWDEPKK